MRTICTFFIILFMLLAGNASAQHEHLHHDINKLDKEIELLLDTAAKHMINFILTQKESEYATAKEKIARAEELNKIVVSKSEEEKGVSKKIENNILEDRKEEFASYQDPELKDVVLKEKTGDRKIKVKFRGHEYRVSPKTKELYETFISYLPRN